jgi:hypothetical protein
MSWPGWQGVLHALVYPERAAGEPGFALFNIPHIQALFLLELVASLALGKQVYNLRQAVNNLSAPVIVFFTMRERRQLRRRTNGRVAMPCIQPQACSYQIC